MKKIIPLHFQSVVLFFACISFICLSLAESTFPQVCTPVYFQKSYQRVYRQNRIYLEGLADITGDGKPDAYGYELQANNSFQNLVILPNDGLGGFGNPIVINTTFPISNAGGNYLNHNYGGLMVGNLNGDNQKDFVVRAATSPQALYSLQNNGGGNSFTASPPTLLSTDEYIVDIVDFNADGRGDLLTIIIPFFQPGILTSNVLYYRLGNADGTFGAAVLLESNNLISPVVGNFAGDSKPDITFTYSGSPSGYPLRLLTNLGNGLFSSSTPLIADTSLAGVADLNADGNLDVYGYNVLLNNGNGGFSRIDLPSTPAPDFPTGFIYTTVLNYLSDINGDGKKDVIQSWAGRQHLGNMKKRFFNAYVNDGSASFTKSIIKQPRLGIPADMNGDGKDEEVIFVNSTSGTPRFSGSNETAVIVRTGVCTQPAASPQTKLLDFGGDGISDIALWKPSNGQWQYVSNLTGGTFNWGIGSAGDIPAPGDFDADGKSDFSVFRNSTGDWYVFRSSDATYYSLTFGTAGDKPVPADYNGDGKTDIAVFRPSDGVWYISFTGTQSYLAVLWGVNGDVPVPNDYDGDGKTDLAIFRPSDGSWYYLKSSDGNFRAIRWGVSSDIPVPADYDMDGKADIAVFRPSASAWYIYRSYDSGVDYVTFGGNGDIPMAVDSDGDGIMEIAVYRPSNFFWYAGSQEAFNWGSIETGTPIRMFLPNN